MKVTALLVCHNGERWLPAVISGLEASTRLPDAFLTVDTGSDDGTVALVEAAFGPGTVSLPAATTYAAAVQAGLDALPPTGDPDEWIWLLHDDANPAPDCLARLVRAAEESGEHVAVVGPKLREWPSLKRLLEVGVTMSGTGRRETGLEAGEYDQGQHDEESEVLAVNTAGMLVRRDVLEQHGFDRRLPLYGNDVDFCWRLARAGHRTVVVPDAVMFHVEAAHRGVRDGALASRPRRDERAGAMYTLLVNGSPLVLPWRVLRLFLGTLLRVLGFLVVRSPAEARDELAALRRVYGHPARIVSGRRRRRRAATVPAREVRHLLAPPWVPYRHGLDFLTDLGLALFHAAQESWSRPQDGHSLPARLVRSVAFWAVLGTFVLAFVADHGLAFGSEPLHGGALLAAPDAVAHWWHTWADSWHWIGIGSDRPGPAYLLPVALLGTLLFGNPGWVVWLVFILGVPLALLGALRFLRRVVPGQWAPLWGALTYAALPVVSGSVAQGRLGTVAAIVLLPWAATAALGLASPDEDRSWRATWRTTLGVFLLGAFAPTAYLLTLVLVLLAPWLSPVRLRRQQLVVIAGTPLLLLAPWLAGALAAPGAFVLEAGRGAVAPVHPGVWEVLTGRSGGAASAPWLLGIGVPLAALVALVRRDTRTRVVRAWLVALAAGALLLVVARVSVSVPGIPEPFRAWPGFLLLAVQAAFVLAATLAADGAVRVASDESFGWRQPVAAIAVLAALAAPVAGAAWWVLHGTDGPLHRSSVAVAPAYMGELADSRPDGATLVLRGGPSGTRSTAPVQYTVLRSDADRIGDDGVRALTEPDPGLSSAVSAMLTGSSSGIGSRLRGYGISYVYAPAPVSEKVSGALDASSGFASASAPKSDTRAWRVVGTTPAHRATPTGSMIHPALLAVQVLALLAVLVLALPTRQVRAARNPGRRS